MKFKIWSLIGGLEYTTGEVKNENSPMRADLIVDIVLDETDVSAEPSQLLRHAEEAAAVGEDARVAVVEVDHVAQRRLERVAGLLAHPKRRQASKAAQLAPNTLPLHVVADLSSRFHGQQQWINHYATKKLTLSLNKMLKSIM